MTMTAASLFESERIRSAWESVRPVSLRVAAEQLALNFDVMVNARKRNPEGFPGPIEIAGDHEKLMIYFAAELKFWDETGRDLSSLEDSDRRLLERIRNRNTVQVAKVLPTTLAHAATVLLPGLNVATAVKRVRTWRDRDTPEMPGPLPVSADYTIASCVFSLPELTRWYQWWAWKRLTA